MRLSLLTPGKYLSRTALVVGSASNAPILVSAVEYRVAAAAFSVCPPRLKNPLRGCASFANDAPAAGCHLQMHCRQPADDEARLVVVIAIAGRTMLLLIHLDRGRVLQKLFEDDSDFHASERRARADMRSTAEREVLLDPRSIEHQRFRILPTARVAIGRRERDHHLGSGRNAQIAEARVLARYASGHLGRSFQTQDFLQQLRNQCGILAQALLEAGFIDDELHRVAQQFRARVLPCSEQERGEPHDFERIRNRAVGISSVG